MSEEISVMRSHRTPAPLLGLLFLGACYMEPSAEEFAESSAAVFAPSGCPAPPEGTPEDTVLAMEEVNRVRRAGGLGCVAHSPEIAFAAKRHCQYYMNNTGRCTAKPHREISECKSFMAETFSDRLRMASYEGHPRFEVMAYVGHGRVSVGQWLDSVWHRIPILSPDVDQAGYGQFDRCDTMDFGNRAETSVMSNGVYPFEGQQGVPTFFSGRENPEPPAPPRGWPSGYPVTLYATGMVVTEHSISVDGSSESLPHIFLAPGDARAHGLLVDEFFLYTHEPMKAKTRYRVRMAGKQHGEPVVFEWTFTTR